MREPRLNGESALKEMAHSTPTPSVTWSAPAVGKPTLYTIRVLRARVVDGVATFNSVAAFYTAETSLEIPPDVLLHGEHYVLSIRATVGEGVGPTAPWACPLHIGWAESVTARFTP